MKKLLPQGSKSYSLKWVDVNLKHYNMLSDILCDALKDIFRDNGRVENIVERVQGKIKEMGIVGLPPPVDLPGIVEVTLEAIKKASYTVARLEVLRDFVKEELVTAAVESSQIADIDMGIESQDLHHDLKLLTAEIEKLFKWHELNHVRDEFLAPYSVVFGIRA